MADMTKINVVVAAYKVTLDSLAKNKRLDYISFSDLPLISKNELRLYSGKGI